MAYKDLEKKRIWFQNRYKTNVTFVNKYKLDAGCADCGYNEHHAALEFDHLPQFIRKKSVSTLVGSSMKVILEEIEKCDVVCSNCHSIRTYERGR